MPDLAASVANGQRQSETGDGERPPKGGIPHFGAVAPQPGASPPCDAVPQPGAVHQPYGNLPCGAHRSDEPPTSCGEHRVAPFEEGSSRGGDAYGHPYEHETPPLQASSPPVHLPTHAFSWDQPKKGEDHAPSDEEAHRPCLAEGGEEGPAQGHQDRPAHHAEDKVADAEDRLTWEMACGSRAYGVAFPGHPSSDCC